MEVSTRAKERFCKDCNIPLNLFQEPFFTDRLELYDKFFGTLEKWQIFISELKKYPCEQDYFEEYNRIKDVAIESIKSTEAYQRFNNEDMNRYRIKNGNLPSDNIFKETNDGMTFISMDMRKANFSALQYYDKNIFRGAKTWEDFIGNFTNNRHIISSKYIRQVILGNCNPKRHIVYEKYLMDCILIRLTDIPTLYKRIVVFSNDEIVVDVSDCTLEQRELLLSQIECKCRSITIPMKIELFTLYKIIGTKGYYKCIYDTNGNCTIELKCLNTHIIPFVMRKVLGEELMENDTVFQHEGLLAKYIEIPEIELNITVKK